jgi:DNA invertase Pin-like site-specific DNA recombinase
MNTKVCLLIRVSSEKQDTRRQHIELTDFCKKNKFTVARTISTTISGAKKEQHRPDIKELLAAAKGKEFTKVIVTEISRLGRRARDIRHTIDRLHEMNVSVVFKNFAGLESLDERGNETFVTNIIVSIYAELAQEEGRLISERTKSGLEAARKRGAVLGRPKGKEKNGAFLKKYPRLVSDINKGLTLRQCEKLHNLSRNTVIKVKKLI